MNEPPIVAQLAAPQTPPAPRVGCAIVGCLGVFLLLLAVVVGAASYGIYHVVRIANESSARQRAERQALQAELAEQSSEAAGRADELVAAFSADDPGVSPE